MLLPCCGTEDEEWKVRGFLLNSEVKGREGDQECPMVFLWLERSLPLGKVAKNAVPNRVPTYMPLNSSKVSE